MLYKNQRNQINADSQKVAQDEVRKLVVEVGKLIDLPTSEEPTVVTVTDVSKLASQPFFAKAKNGDKVLIYTNAKKAILYDPQTKKIIDTAPINVGSPSAQVSVPKVVLRNGTQTTGLTTKVETEIKKTIQVDVTIKENASKNNYDKTIIVIMNNSAKDIAESIAKVLNASVGDLPTGEEKPAGADILVILGKDRI